MYKINITINENKETNLPSGILWGNQTNKDLYSQSSKTTYYTISWNIEIARQGLNITNHYEIWQTHLWQCCRDVSWISERCDDYNIASCGLESFFVVRCLKNNPIESMNSLPPKILVTRPLTTCIHRAALCPVTHSQTTPSAPSHPLRYPRTGVGPTHLCLLAD